MATIEMSPGFVNGYVTRMHSLSTFTGAPASSILSRASTSGLLTSTFNSNYSNTSNTYFYIMKGTVPVNFSTLVNFNARSADVLITYVTASLAPGDFSPTIANVNPSNITTNYVNATATGTATWFWWTQRATVGGSVNGTDALVQQVIGTVGIIGSGADLEIPSVSIVSGSAYRVNNLRLSWPTSWVF